MKPILFLVFAAALYAQPKQGINFYSIEKEIALGNQLAADFQRSATTTSDARAEKLGTALVPQSSPFQYHFRVFDGGGREAVVFPGGWVFVPQPLLARDDRRLSAILAHAIAHIELRHYTRLATRRELRQIGMTAAAYPGVTEQLSLGLLKLQRSFELAADLHAIQLLRAAGLDPASLVDYLRTLPTDDRPMLSAQPDPQSRIDAAEKAIAALPH
jgi:predicted Zn-dependent protease